MIKDFLEFLDVSYTAYQAVENIKAILLESGFIQLTEGQKWNIKPNSSYFVIRDGSSLIAFKTGDLKDYAFNIVAGHTDSPCLRIKNNSVVYTENYAKLNVETYGGGLYYTMLDRPLKIAGRVIVKEGNCLKSIPAISDFYVTIPSLAIHINREANNKLSLNPQTDLMPLVGLGKNVDLLKAIVGEAEVVDYDLFIVPASKPYTFGINNEFMAAPRLDDLAGAYGGIMSLINSNPSNLAICACFDNEEIGSSTKQGAGSTFLKDVLKTINHSLKKDKLDFKNAVNNGFMVSLDNAHAVHPNFESKSDPTNRCLVGKGIAIKHHAGFSYMTDSFSSAVFKQIMEKANVPYQDFYNRSDARSGGTLGAISNRQISIRTVDVGIPQLAMHSFCETMGAHDMEMLLSALTAFYNTKIKALSYDVLTVE